MSFFKSAWFSFLINFLDGLIHYLAKKGVIELEDRRSEE